MAAERRLSVDWPACKGHGLCAELVPELVTLDEWGYPILADRPVTRGVQSHAQRAVAACPTLALVLVDKPVARSEAPSRPAGGDPISGAIQAVTGSNPIQRRTPVTPPTGPTRVRGRRPAPSTPQPGPAPQPVPPAPEPVHYAPAPIPPRTREPLPRTPEPMRRQPEPTYQAPQYQEPLAPEPSQGRRAAPEEPLPTRRSRREQPLPTRRSERRQRPSQPVADDPITGAIQAVTGPNAVPRRTPPTGTARHATPAYGQPALVPEAQPYDPGDSFFDGYQPREAYEPSPPTSRREAKQNEQPRSRREARARRQ